MGEAATFVKQSLRRVSRYLASVTHSQDRLEIVVSSGYPLPTIASRSSRCFGMSPDSTR